MSYLLMGGQACVLYGGAEFSRDTDLVLADDEGNLRRLQAAVDQLQAETIAVPPFDKQYLDEGLAVHFRCRHPEAAGMRVDVMTRLRGVPKFAELWLRRTTMDWNGEAIEVLGLPDLVRAKHTQRDKDWSMIRRLVERNYLDHSAAPSPQQIQFWCQSLRTPAMLTALARDYPEDCRRFAADRPLLLQALAQDETAVEAGLEAEEAAERSADRAYWVPLRARLETLRAGRRRD